MRRRLRRRALIGAGLVTMMVLGGLGAWAAGALADPDPAEDLLGRAWVNRTPESPRGTFHLLYLDDESDYGVTLHGSQLRHLVNVLAYTYDGDGALKLTSRQDNVTVPTHARTSSCDGPGVLDLCLDLTVKGRGGRGRTVRLYSSTSWDDGVPPEAAQLRLRADLPAPTGPSRTGTLDALGLPAGR